MKSYAAFNNSYPAQFSAVRFTDRLIGAVGFLIQWLQFNDGGAVVTADPESDRGC
jgi:hypothetical protein